MAIYFCISPFLLGNLNYKNFSNYENELETRYNILYNKIFIDYPFFYIFKNNYNAHLGPPSWDICCPFHEMAFKAFLTADKKIPILMHSLNY